MRFLLRTRHGAFAIENAVTIEEIQNAKETGGIDKYLLPLDYPLAGLPALSLPQDYWKLARNGGKLPAGLLPELNEKERCRVYAAEELLGVAHRENDLLRFDVGLTGG